MARPRKRAAASEAPPTGPRRDDPDVGPTRQTPSAGSRIEQAELATRALKLRHMQQQSKMAEEANKLTAYPKEDQ